MLTVHHLQQSRSKRVLWLLEELAMPYQLEIHQRDPVTRLAPASLKAIHPLAKAPVIVDGQVTLCESGAVMEYLLDKSSSNDLRPAKDSANYYLFLEWLHFAEGSLALPVITNMLLSLETRGGKQAMDGYIAKEIALDFSYIEAHLNTHDYFAGEAFTAADIMMTIVLEFAERQALLATRPATQTYLAKVQQRPAYICAAKQG
ncbi:glutathione S-transferase [Agarivorans sp. TSD2052]|uniref:glutathione S-transferase family protein n=1 Tax=Agarivorans sp. TSD2052 TaxID=2937286 RepID=UPI00200FF9E5|nr:glutathione S-transferase [Agarivorans sp. TSD2052]UPW19667.1 glutathione S-transferase [Agarivorans sp. TSD2052]